MEKSNLEKQQDLIGGQYQISVLRDNFVPMILEALGKVNTEKVWANTAKTSTVYRGKTIHVLDCIKAGFSHIYDDSLPYITMTATFFKDTTDDLQKDYPFTQDTVLQNDTKKSFHVLGRMSLFPFGTEDMETLASTIALFADKRGVSLIPGQYADDFEGDVDNMFALVEDILAYSNQHFENYALNISMTIYGPEAQK